VAQPRGIYTTPMKRWGFGYNRTTLSEIHSHKGVVRALSWLCRRWRMGLASTGPVAESHCTPQTGEYEYIADPGRGQRSASPQGGDARAPFRPPQLVSGNSFATYAVRSPWRWSFDRAPLTCNPAPRCSMPQLFAYDALRCA